MSQINLTSWYLCRKLIDPLQTHEGHMIHVIVQYVPYVGPHPLDEELKASLSVFSTIYFSYSRYCKYSYSITGSKI